MSDKKLKETKVDFEKLRFIRVFTPEHIPKYLIEQIKHRDYTVENWYKYQQSICVVKTESGPQLNPLSLLFVIANDNNKVVGVFWASVDSLEQSLVIQTFSMDKDYWSRGRAVKLLSDQATDIMRKCKLKKIYWVTNYPKHSEKYGFERSKSVLMEFKESEDGQNIDGWSETDRCCGASDAGTKIWVGPTAGSRDGTRSRSSNESPGRNGTGTDAGRIPEELCGSSDASVPAADDAANTAAND